MKPDIQFTINIISVLKRKKLTNASI